MGCIASFSFLMLLLTGSGHSRSNVIVDEVDLVEVNHFHDESGKLIFKQIIFYDWCEETKRYQVRAWRSLKKEYQLPAKDWDRDCYSIVWDDGSVRRVVRAKELRETQTQYDPELVEREYRPKEYRAELERRVAGEVVRR